MQRLLPTLTVVNLIATAELKQPVDLERLVYVNGFLYDTTIYRCAYLKDHKMKSKISLFSTGKMISVGSKSMQTAKRDLQYAARRLAELGLITPTRVVVKLQNIVATSSLGRSISLENLSTWLPQTIYEPDQFPGAIHYAKELEGASILIFANGKVVFAGLRRLDLLDKAKHVLMQLAEQIT